MGDDRESHPLAPSAPRGSEQGSGGSKQGMALGPILKPEVPFHGQAEVLYSSHSSQMTITESGREEEEKEKEGAKKTGEAKTGRREVLFLFPSLLPKSLSHISPKPK